MRSTLFVVFVLIQTITTQNQRSKICDFLNNRPAVEAISEKCLSQLNTICYKGDILWKMFDASSKYPLTGMSYTNNMDLGNYDECISINYRDSNEKILGKHCTFSVVVINPLLQQLPSPFTYGPPRNHPPKPTGPTPLTSLLSTCVPDSCTPEEVGKFFIWGDFNITSIIPDYNGSLVSPIVINKGALCTTRESNTEFSWGSIVFLVFLGGILLLLVFCTAYDYTITLQGKKSLHPLFISFSLLTNGRKLLHVNRQRNPEQFSSINGMRVISILWVMAGHNVAAFQYLPLINYAEVHEWIGNVKVQYLASAPIAVDTFFFLSGFLLAFGYLKMAKKLSTKQQIVGIPMMFIHRYLRLTPALAVLYFLLITVSPMLGSGPLWGTVSNIIIRQCQDHWWSFFLYVQNYVNYKDLCLIHTWYLSADMQMFMLAPIVLIPIVMLVKRNKTITSLWSLFCLIIITVIFPIGIRFADESYNNIYDTHSRFNDYLIGILLGVIMREYLNKPFYFTKIQNFVIWVIVLACCLAFNLYLHDVVLKYTHTKDTLFHGLYRPLWCSSLAWMIYSCYHGYGGPIDWILSRPIFQVLGKLSYCMYLIHGPVQEYWIGTVRTNYRWSDYEIFYMWCGHFVLTMIISLVWSLAFESPIMVIEKLIFGGGGKKASPKKAVETRNRTDSNNGTV